MRSSQVTTLHGGENDCTAFDAILCTFVRLKNMGRMSKSEGWEGGEEGFAALRLPFGLPFGREHFVVASLREPHTGLAADSCCKTSSSASRFNERVCSKDNGKVVVARRQ